MKLNLDTQFERLELLLPFWAIFVILRLYGKRKGNF